MTSTVDGREFTKDVTEKEEKDSQRLSEHVRYIHDTMEEADIETVLGLLDSWASEIRQLEDLLDKYKQDEYDG